MLGNHCLKSFFLPLTASVFLFSATFAALAQAASDSATPIALSNQPISTLRCNQFTFDATGSHDPDNENIDFMWDFGDGTSSEEPVATHKYERSGDYVVKLTITDNSGLQCSTATTSQVVRANIPPKAAFTAPDMVCTNDQITVDGSASSDEDKNPLSFTWNFGDGTVTKGEQRVKKIYSKGGDYKISLTVDDNSKGACNTDTIEKIIHVNEPPVAEAGEDVKLVCVDDPADFLVSFDATKSTDNNNNPLIYAWDFGDRTSGEGAQVTHRYNDIGNYDVKLIVRDNSTLGCSTGVDFQTVRINRAPIAKAGPDITVCASDTVTFDGSESIEHKKGTSSYKWFFGDGQTTSGVKATHQYVKPGKYQASLVVENALNTMCAPSKDTLEVNINTPPSVTLKTRAASCVGDSIEFDASSANDADGDDLEYYWSFGDGTILRSGPKVTHTYNQGGSYRVSVIVDDGKQTSCSTATANETIKINSSPVASAGTNLSCCVNKEAVFDAAASSDPDGDTLIYKWNFGDGTTREGATLSHAYKQSGSYNVVLTVDDQSGTACSTATAGFTAQVNTSPVPVITVR